MVYTGNNYITPQAPGRAIVKFVQGTDATLALKNVYIAGANGSKFWGLTAVNTDSAVHNLTLAVVNAGSAFQANAVALAANAGNNGTVVPASPMSPTNWPGLSIDNDGNPYLFLANGDTLQAQYATTLGAGTTLSLFGLAADF